MNKLKIHTCSFLRWPPIGVVSWLISIIFLFQVSKEKFVKIQFNKFFMGNLSEQCVRDYVEVNGKRSAAFFHLVSRTSIPHTAVSSMLSCSSPGGKYIFIIWLEISDFYTTLTRLRHNWYVKYDHNNFWNETGVWDMRPFIHTRSQWHRHDLSEIILRWGGTRSRQWSLKPSRRNLNHLLPSSWRPSNFKSMHSRVRSKPWRHKSSEVRTNTFRSQDSQEVKDHTSQKSQLETNKFSQHEQAWVQD